MNKINFQNGTLVAKAKVTINGTVYEVEPEEYEGTTPLNAENLNQIQTNVENAIPPVVDTLTSTSATDALSANQGKVLKELLEGTVLYNNSTGTSSNFTLNESSANYRRFVIEAKNRDESVICIVPEIIDPDGKKFPIMTINTGGGYGKTYIGNSTWQISGNTVTKIQSNALTTLNNNGPIQIEGYDNVVITKVIGYNY